MRGIIGVCNVKSRAVAALAVFVAATAMHVSAAFAGDAATASAASAGTNSSLKFSCPDLANTEKMTLDAMTQGQNGWFYRLKADLKPEFRLMDESANYMARLVAALKARGTQMVFLPVPPRGIAGREQLDLTNPDQASYSPDEAAATYQTMLDTMRRTGLIVPDLMQASQLPVGDGSDFFFHRDHHWTSLGARKSAQILAETLKENPIYKQQTLSKFVTTSAGEGQMKHTMAMEIQRLCQGDIPAEPFPMFKTTMEASGADALFGDAAGGEPSVLVGSSFSAQQDFNFDGEIMQATGLNIANYAISAGLLFNAIVSLSSDPQFQTMKPPFLIWEAPSVYDMNIDSTPAFRQIIPGVFGQCKPEDAVATNKFSIKNGQGGTLITVPAAAKVHSSRYYLVIDSTSRGFAKFTLQMDYDDGDGEWFTVDRSQHFNNAGRFFVEFSDEIDSNLTSISVDGLGNVSTDLDIRICRAPKGVDAKIIPAKAEEASSPIASQTPSAPESKLSWWDRIIQKIKSFF